MALPTAAAMEVVAVEMGIQLLHLEVQVGMAQTAQAAQADRVVMVPEEALGTTTPLGEGEAEAEVAGPLLEEAPHQAEDLEEAVMEATTGMKGRRGAGLTLP